MGKRRKARECSLQILFQLEFNNSQPQAAITQFWEKRRVSGEVREFSSWLVNGILSHRQKIDEIIQSVSENWRLKRMALVDRNILRIATFELLFEENVPPAVIINEAIEIAKKYSSPEAATFVNGILDGVRKKLETFRKATEEKRNE